MGEFLRRIKDQEGLRVLDLGPTSSKNITFFTAQGNSIHNEDLLLESTLPAYVVNGGRFNHLAPFGGYKKSGIGRELGPHAIDEFLQMKAIQR
jgi:acyl-CoA reductase-like NAD-dependent aldehyde dehydrogenase